MKIISIDFWGTACVSNPDYKNSQFELLKLYEPEISIQEWKEKVKELKIYTDKIVESTGKHIYRSELYKSMFPDWSYNRINEFISYSNELFIKHPPIPTKLIDHIERWKEVGNKLYICSNTVFVHGDVLSKVIYSHFGIVKSSCRFSDEVGLSKPSPVMWNFPMKPEYHIGDNEITDGSCEALGIEFIHVDTLIKEHQTKLGKLETIF